MLLQSRELLWQWTWRGIRARYMQTALGGTWAVIQPLSMMVIFTLVFSFVVQVDTGSVPYPLFSYVALLPWTLFASSLSSAIPSLVDNMHLVTKVFFPREIFPLSQICARMVDFCIAALVLAGMMFYYGLSVQMTWLWVVPLLFLQLLLTVGISLLGAAVNVFYRDVRHAITLLVQLWMYVTPVIYPATLVPEKYRMVYGLNPMVGLIESYRNTVLMGTNPPYDLLALSVTGSVLSLAVGYWYFRRVEWEFGDII